MSEGEDNHDFPCRGSSDDQGAQETLLGPDIVKRKTFFQGISFDEIPDFVQNAGVLADCNLTETGEKSALLRQALIAQLAHSE